MDEARLREKARIVRTMAGELQATYGIRTDHLIAEKAEGRHKDDAALKGEQPIDWNKGHEQPRG